MVGTVESLDALKSIGLNLYERKIFVALLAKGVATAAEVSEIANVPRSRSYDVLESLADKGFVVMQPSKPIKYVALKPSEALERSKDSIKRRHDEMLERIERLKSSPILGQLDGVYKQGLNLVEPSEMTGTMKGSFIINRQLRSIFKEAKKSINIVTTEAGLQELNDNHGRALKKLSKSGVKVKILAPFEGGKGVASELAQVADVRKLSQPVGKFAIVDNNHVFMSLTDDKKVHESQHVALWASSAHAADKIVGPLFNHLWEGSAVVK
jgi:sugar-specific transcriptional regulator TrmB